MWSWEGRSRGKQNAHRRRYAPPQHYPVSYPRRRFVVLSKRRMPSVRTVVVMPYATVATRHSEAAKLG